MRSRARTGACCVRRSSPGSYGRSPRRPAENARAPGHRTIEGGTMSAVFVEREVLEEAADRWWLFLLTGIAWLVFALIVFQWDYTTVSAISYPLRRGRDRRGRQRVLPDLGLTTGWKWVHGLLGVLFIVAGIYALWHPYDTFATLAALVGHLPARQGHLRHHRRVRHEGASSSSGGCSSSSACSRSCSRSGSPATSARRRSCSSSTSASSRSSRGISEIFVAFKLKGLRRRLAAA